LSLGLNEQFEDVPLMPPERLRLVLGSQELRISDGQAVLKDGDSLAQRPLFDLHRSAGYKRVDLWPG
jgi:hypothetical protein